MSKPRPDIERFRSGTQNDLLRSAHILGLETNDWYIYYVHIYTIYA